jgi:hypothetical protein
MPGQTVQNYATYPIMPGALASIMPGQTLRDNGHKALMLVIMPPFDLVGSIATAVWTLWYHE